MAFNLDDYEPVADRIERFWNDHPDGSIRTELVHRDDQRFIVKASVWREIGFVIHPASTGFAEEVIGSTNVNRTSALENCETSAIGRALANLGYAVKNRASREEMVKAQPAPRPRSGGKVSPSKPPQSHEDAPRTNGNGESGGEVRRLKSKLLEKVKGDKPKAMMLWRNAVGFFGLEPDEEIPADMLEALESHLNGTLEPVVGGTDPANGTS